MEEMMKSWLQFLELLYKNVDTKVSQLMKRINLKLLIKMKIWIIIIDKDPKHFETLMVIILIFEIIIKIIKNI